MSKAILGLIPTMQSLKLASEGHKMVVKPKKKVKHFVKGTTKILVGIPLMKVTANQIAGF